MNTWKGLEKQAILSKLGIAYSMYFFVNGLDDTAPGNDWDNRSSSVDKILIL